MNSGANSTNQESVLKLAASAKSNADLVKSRIENRGKALDTLVNGYIRNVQIVVDVTKLLNNYNSFITELLKYLTDVNNTLNTMAMTDDLQQLKARTTEQIRVLEKDYAESIKILQPFVPHAGNDSTGRDPNQIFTEVKNTFSTGGKVRRTKPVKVSRKATAKPSKSA